MAVEKKKVVKSPVIVTGNTEEMSVHKALAELKIIGDRIVSAIEGTAFVVANRHSSSKISGVSIAEFSNAMKNNYQSIKDLIRRRDALRRAVVLSNAVTTVIIGDNTYTVAEAIEMKNTGIKLKQILLQSMKQQYDRCRGICTTENNALPRSADQYIIGMYQSKDTKLTEDMAKSREEYILNNTFELVEPIKVLEEIKKLEEEIALFTTEVDAALSVSNAVTIIKFSY